MNITNRNEALDDVTQNGLYLQFASPELRNDREIVLAAVNRDGLALRFASPELQGNREIVLAAVNNEGRALEYVSLELRRDRETVLAAIKQNLYSTFYLHPNLYNGWNNKKIYLLSRDMYNNNILNNDIIKSITKFL